MYPTTIFEIIDQSQIKSVTTEIKTSPLFMLGFAAAKGPEEMTVANASNFYKLYGNDIDFTKYGQPLLQAAAIVDAGGSVLAKRVVSDKSTLANRIIVATVASTGESAAKKATITFSSVTATNAKTMADIITEAEKSYVEGSAFPLYAITDNGRGSSKKRFRISPDYNSSKYASYMKYSFEEIEDNSIIERFIFSLDPDVVDASINRSMTSMMRTKCLQLRCKQFDQYIGEFYKAVASAVTEFSALKTAATANGATEYASTLDERIEYVKANDILFGMSKRAVAIPEVVVDTSALNLSYAYGLPLEGGGDGDFAVASPISVAEYTDKLVEYFNGTFTDDIYDRDNYKIDVITDANYPATVKRAIEQLVTFREDCIFIRDMGTNNTELEYILTEDAQNLHNKFCATYHNYYDILNPYTKKQITVTIPYNLSILLCAHFLGGRTRPTAGILYGFTIPEAIEGTVNFIPKHTPEENQKETLDDARINYASYYEGVLTVETLYTSQADYTQLSYINNMLAIQEIIKAVRTRCPQTRYSFISGDDLSTYKADVEEVLARYSANFKSLTLEYLNDDTYIQNKIFYAAIKVTFRDFVQTEYFKLYALI